MVGVELGLCTQLASCDELHIKHLSNEALELHFVPIHVLNSSVLLLYSSNCSGDNLLTQPMRIGREIHQNISSTAEYF